MKYLFIVLFLIGCGGESKDNVAVVTVEQPQYNFIETELIDLTWQSGGSYGGTVTQTGDKDWYFETHTNLDCFGVLKGKCRKSSVMLTEGLPVEGRVTKYSFDIGILKYNMDDSPDHVIIWQMWAKLFDEPGGNHPPQTIKLLNDNGQLKYCGFDNAWQFELETISELGHSPDGSTHPHPDDRNNGCSNTELNSSDKIDLYVWDNGRTAFYVNDKLIFDKEYQVKGVDREHKMFWGAYWSIGYNKEIDPSKSIELTINGFSRSVYLT